MTKERNKSIGAKLMRGIMLISGSVLMLTCLSFFGYEFFKSRQVTKQKLSTIGKIVSDNGAAALAFRNERDATEILNSLQFEPHVVAACFYDADGEIFAFYPADINLIDLPNKVGIIEYRFKGWHLEGFETVMMGDSRFGTLYIRSDLKDLTERYVLYLIIVFIIIAVAILLAYFLSNVIRTNILSPIFRLADTAKTISAQRDYSVRAERSDDSELGLLTDAFNHMLEKVEISNKELEQFVYVASHDLQEPLRTITNFLGLVEEQCIASEKNDKKNYFHFINHSVGKMQDLIRDLLDFSRVGKDVKFSQVDVNQIIKDVLLDIAVAIQESGAEIQSANLPIVFGHEVKLKQLFQNLISNGIKFRRKSIKPSIIIDFQEGKHEYIFSVKDNGIGIEEKDIKKLFVIFQRLNPADEYPGTGIGLAICKKIVELHNGKIWVESNFGKGSTFYFTIPKQ